MKILGFIGFKEDVELRPLRPGEWFINLNTGEPSFCHECGSTGKRFILTPHDPPDGYCLTGEWRHPNGEPFVNSIGGVSFGFCCAPRLILRRLGLRPGDHVKVGFNGKEVKGFVKSICHERPEHPMSLVDPPELTIQLEDEL